MRRLPQLGTLVLTLALAVLGLAAEDTGRVSAATDASASERYLAPAADAIARSGAWWDGGRHWYRERLGRPAPATLWGSVHLFEATSAVAIADPTRAHRAAVRRFAAGAERYWNPQLRPVPGYSPHPDTRGPSVHTWYDDNGWWGVAFYDAYRATGDARYLASAKRALLFVDSGWDRRKGGIWWDTAHAFHAGESLASGTLLAASLYRETRSPKYLAIAKRYVGWADADFRGNDRLYDRHERDQTPMPYVQGPMFNAFAILCQATGDRAYCREAEELANRAAERFPALTMGPQYDAMYIRALVELYRYDHNPRWYGIAAAATDRAMANGREPSGLYLRAWDGRPMSSVDTPSGELQTHAATALAMAWVAAADAPGAP